VVAGAVFGAVFGADVVAVVVGAGFGGWVVVGSVGFVVVGGAVTEVRDVRSILAFAATDAVCSAFFLSPPFAIPMMTKRARTTTTQNHHFL
jgi:hypothetical protein